MNRLFLSLVFLLISKMHHASAETFKMDKNFEDTPRKEPVYMPWNRLTVNFGYYFSNNSTGITLGSKEMGIGIVIDMERFLSLETSTAAVRGNVNYTFGKRKRSNLYVDYYSINRRASKKIEAELKIFDITYPVGTLMESKFNLSIIRAIYGYTFLLDNRFSLGVSAGLFVMPITFEFQTTNYADQTTRMIAPFPVFGLRSKVAITPKLYLNESAELLYLKINQFTGSLLDLNIALEYKAFKHFGLGVGLNSNKIKFASQGNDYPNVNFFGDIKMEYFGALLYASYFL